MNILAVMDNQYVLSQVISAIVISINFAANIRQVKINLNVLLTDDECRSWKKELHAKTLTDLNISIKLFIIVRI